MDFLSISAVFIGGGLGATLRYICLLYCNFLNLGFPAVTLGVNVIGSFILGAAYMFFLQKSSIPEPIKVFLTIGFCGGLTTFSTFSHEMYLMIKNEAYFYALFYGLASVLVCLISVFCGIILVKRYA